MNKPTNREIIEQYISAYNSFDVEGMIGLMSEDCVFRNIAGGEMDTETKGIQEFKQLAEQSAGVFSSRCQTVTSYLESESGAEVEIDYKGKLAVDLPNGLKAGDQIQLKGRSKFELLDGKLVLIEDYS
ncbi:nuclear transport factor 2 family protein [Paenibacillus sp. J22TS3]|uniref:nuclear transport factor 2 family protein n=1 Tax=Paenibacillus sp. J22TS3 TaxID=2807192 RepID=UPI001B05EFDB|nr:nuclear transport factor 2 family protein [Paenibacillus sp. J22TS3]GIP23727.1 hypothetical protein J22TS3_40020 [Paenibacillus sp. J22TS3]